MHVSILLSHTAKHLYLICPPSLYHSLLVYLLPHPPAEMVEHFLSVKRKGRRKPRLSEPTLVSLKQNVTNSPMKQLIPRPSPTPISPSYKRTSSKVRGCALVGGWEGGRGRRRREGRMREERQKERGACHMCSTVVGTVDPLINRTLMRCGHLNYVSCNGHLPKSQLPLHLFSGP